MKRILTFTLVAILLGLSALAAPTVSAQSEGDALCDLAISQAGTGRGQFGRYELVYGSGGGGSQVVVGTAGDDVLDGGTGNDILCGLGGDDILIGGSGNDILIGGPGVDELYGGTGGDTLYGEVGETLDGGTGRNQIIREAPAPPDLPSLTAEISTLDEGECTLTLTLTGAPDGIVVAFNFEVLNGIGTTGGNRTVDSSRGAVDRFGLNPGTVVTEAFVERAATGDRIATVVDVGTCGSGG